MKPEHFVIAVCLIHLALLAIAAWRWRSVLFPRFREPDLRGMTSAERIAFFERGLRREIQSQDDARRARELSVAHAGQQALDDVQRRAPVVSVRITALEVTARPELDPERIAALPIPQPDKHRVMHAMLTASGMPPLRPNAR